MTKYKIQISGKYHICPNEWITDKRIKSELKLLLKISSLTATTGYCYATNKYLSEALSISEVTISRYINRLLKWGYLQIDYKKRGAEVVSREIRLTKLITVDEQKSASTMNKTDNRTMNKTDKDNNISSNSLNNNNLILNKRNINKESDKTAKAVIDMFNKEIEIELNKVGYSSPKYRYVDSYLKLIKARLNEGFTLEDIEKVIKAKASEWAPNEDMRKYLRITTIFNKTKFNKYFDELPFKNDRKSDFEKMLEETKLPWE